MPRYMLDTDNCSYIMKRANEAVLSRLQKVPVSEVCVSVITKSELLFGVEVSPRRQQEKHRSVHFYAMLKSWISLMRQRCTMQRFAQT